MTLLLLYTLAFFTSTVRVLAYARVATVHQFPNETWAENLALRSNGQILTTLLDRFELHLVNPFGEACLVHQFATGQSPLGITEIEHDVFAVLTLDFEPGTFTPVSQSCVAWKVDVRNVECFNGTSSPSAPVSVIANLTRANFVNGMTTLDKSHILIADSLAGVIWRLNWETGIYAVALWDETLLPEAGAPIGTNGIHLHDGFAYYTNTFRDLVARVAIHANGTAAGPFELLASGVTHPDDFDIAPDGTLYVAGDNTLWEVTSTGTVSVVAGGANETVLAGATAVKLVLPERESVYVTTNGGEPAPVDGRILPGKIAAVRVGH